MKPKIITISGASCAGKTFFQQKMISEHGFSRLITTTTRPKRVGEIEGQNYYHVTPAAFESLIAHQSLAENVLFMDNHYGVTKQEVLLKTQGGEPALLVIEPSGITTYRQLAEDNNWDYAALFIQIDEGAAIARMTLRDAGSPDFKKRLANLMAVEMSWQDLAYDIVVPSFTEENCDAVCAALAVSLRHDGEGDRLGY